LPFQDQDRIILVSTTAAASSTGPELNIASPFTSVIFLLNVTAASGTSPTLNVRIQEVLTPAAAADQINVKPTGAKVYDDFVSFTQATGTGNWRARVTGGGNDVAILTDGTMAAAAAKSGPIGCIWRCKYTIAGTNPSFTFNVVARLIP
jgi:hypothetical protein